MKAGALVGAALLIFSTAVNAAVKETEEMTFDVASGARISLENINGTRKRVNRNTWTS